MRPDLPSLPKQQELCKTDAFHVVREIATGRSQGPRFPNDQLRRPIEIVRAVELGLERPEQGVIFQPACLFQAVLLEGRSQIGLCPGIEVIPSTLEKAPLERDDGAVFDRVWRERDALAVARLQQSIRDEKIRADQELVASERRQRLIRRIAVARRPEWQCLPPALPRLLQAIDPCQRRWTQIADPVRGR